MFIQVLASVSISGQFLQTFFVGCNVLLKVLIMLHPAPSFNQPLQLFQVQMPHHPFLIAPATHKGQIAHFKQLPQFLSEIFEWKVSVSRVHFSKNLMYVVRLLVHDPVGHHAIFE